MSDKRPVEGASNDLPAKLRDIGRWAVEAKGVEVVYEAADEIERLRRDREQDAATVLAYSEQCDKWQAEVERLRDSNERWRMAFEAERKHSKQLEERLGRK